MTCDFCRILSICVCTAFGAPATTWFVGSAAEDGGTGRSPASALRTIGDALDSAAAGDTCLVGPGIYHERARFTRSGDPGRPIVLRGDRGQGWG